MQEKKQIQNYLSQIEATNKQITDVGAEGLKA